MPVYYKKVQRNSSDAVRFIDKRSRFSLSNVRLGRRSDSIDNGEFSNVESGFPLISYAKSERTLESREELVETSFGVVLVAKQGAERTFNKPPIVTYHDIGLNHQLNFESYFDIPENKLLLQSFTVIHINAPGQEKHANKFNDEFVFPNMNQLAIQVKEVLDHFEIKSCIGFGSGAGSNILIRLALMHPDLVEGLFLVNPSVGSATWSEWYYHKKNLRSIQSNGGSSLLPQAVQDYLIWHHYGYQSDEREEIAKEVMGQLRTFYKGIALNPHNLSLFIEAVIKRNDLKLSRTASGSDRELKCQTVILCGSLSPFVDDTISTNGRLNPKKATWMKLDNCGHPLEEKPSKVAQSFRLFLQGLGYTLKAYERRRALMSGASMPNISTSLHLGDIGIASSKLIDA